MKVHGAGNDFVLLPDPDDVLTLSAGFVRALCDRHLGIGGDGVIRVAPVRAGVDADVFMDYWNADGSIAEMCGNGVRCVAKYVADRGGVTGDRVRVDTRDGVKQVEIVERAGGKAEMFTVDMGPPKAGVVDEKIDVAGESLRVTTISMGNPHAVFVVDDVDDAPLELWGPELQGHELFPDGTNVEVIQPVGPDQIRGRIWERGVGETMASGTGASAMAAAAKVLGLAGDSTRVLLRGGELRVQHVPQLDTLLVTGPAAEVASGELDKTWLTSI